MKYASGITLFFVVIFISFRAFSREVRENPDEKRIIVAATGVIQRVMGNEKTDVMLSVRSTANGLDSFHVKASNGVVSISGSSVSAICFGFHQYLKKYCHQLYSWSSGTLKAPARWPDCEGLTGGTPYRYRYYLNVVTFGYTTPYWDWNRWEKELDWMAMHGINMPLATVASEAIAQRLWQKQGLKQKDLDNFFTGPAHLPWHRMGNLNKWDGPLPQEWHKDQLTLQHKILNRMKEMGFSPITPAFAGFVPEAFARLHPELNLNPLKWGGFAPEYNGYVLSPETDWFKRIGKLFIEEWEKEFGKNQFYLADAFNEMDVPVDTNNLQKKYDYLANYGRSVYESIKAGNPDAVWVTQGWTFGYQSKFWDKPTLQSLFSKVPDDKMLIIDLGNDYPPYVWHIDPVWKTQEGFYGKQWIYSYVPNFGGKTALTGVVSFYSSASVEALNSPFSKSMIGFGSAPEGIEINELIYELISDMGWTDKVINEEDWVKEYCNARYGSLTPEILSAYKAFLASCYNSFGSYPRFVWQTVRYDNRRKGSVYSDATFLQGIRDFLSAADKMKGNKLYREDAIEFAAMYLGVKADAYYREALIFDSTGNAAKKKAAGDLAIRLLLQADSLLESHATYRLQNWVNYARLHGNTKKLKDYYEANAKRLITTWGGTINDYAARIWSGLIRDYYVPRIQQTLFRTGFDRPGWEEQWIRTPGVSSIAPYADPVHKAAELVLLNGEGTDRDLTFTDARKLTLTGKADKNSPFYYRMDTLKYNNVPPAVKRLLTNTAGMALAFKTNSNTIIARWKLPVVKNYANMSPIAHSGLDLYIRLNGEWTYAGSGAPKALTNEATLVTEMEDGEKECLLYLPLYNGIEQLEIGVPAGSYILPLKDPFRGKVVVYGSSITQGASASRPGLAYLSQLARSSGINFINLGLSGSGKMETAVADMIADIAADAYVLDCAANPGAKEITERTAGFVQKIRSRHPDAPIIMIQSVVREGGTFNRKIRENVAAQNKAFKEEYEKLKKTGVENLYLIESVRFLGSDHEGTADGTHPTDLGFHRFLEIIKSPLLAIIEPVIKKEK